MIKDRLFCWNRLLHRDIGYFCVALTVLYGISGIALNHSQDWNPHYDISRSEMFLQDIPSLEDEAFIPKILETLGISEKAKGGYQTSATVYKIFLEDGLLEVDLERSRAIHEMVRRRPLLFHANYLHLNHPKGIWTLVADLYGGLLLFLGISGLFMIQGRHGFARRGKWLFMMGITVVIWAIWDNW